MPDEMPEMPEMPDECRALIRSINNHEKEAIQLSCWFREVVRRATVNVEERIFWMAATQLYTRLAVELATMWSIWCAQNEVDDYYDEYHKMEARLMRRATAVLVALENWYYATMDDNLWWAACPKLPKWWLFECVTNSSHYDRCCNDKVRKSMGRRGQQIVELCSGLSRSKKLS